MIIEGYVHELKDLETTKMNVVIEEDFDKANDIKEKILSIKKELWNKIHEQGIYIFDEEVCLLMRLKFLCFFFS
jgi:hypothetical protein